MNKLDIIIDNINLYNRLKREIALTLIEYEEIIKNSINKIKENKQIEENKKIIYNLFLIQKKINIISNKLDFELSDYLYDFLYNFDRQDEESVIFLLNKFMNA